MTALEIQALAADNATRAAEKSEVGARRAKATAARKFGEGSAEHKSAVSKWVAASNAAHNAKSHAHSLWVATGIYD